MNFRKVTIYTVEPLHIDKICTSFSSEQFCSSTFFLYVAEFVRKIQFLIFNNIFRD